MTTNFNCSRVFFFLYGTFDIFSTRLPTLLLSISPKCVNFSPNLPLSLSSVSSLYLCCLYRGIKLLAIPVTDTALIRYSPALFPPSLYSLILTLPLAFPNVLAQASILAGNQFAQDFSDCCCTLEKKKKIRNDCMLLYLLNDKAI